MLGKRTIYFCLIEHQFRNNGKKGARQDVNRFLLIKNTPAQSKIEIKKEETFQVNFLFHRKLVNAFEMQN